MTAQNSIHSCFVFDQAPSPECHASTVAQVGDDLLCAWFGGTREGAADVAIYLARFTQGHWMPPVEVARHAGVPCWNPVLFHYPDGETILFYKAGPSPQTWSGLLLRSRDGGAKWSAPELLPAGILGPIKNEPVLLGEELVCGSSVESYDAWGCWVERTSDRGKSWRKSGPINVPGHLHGIIQPAFIRGEGDDLAMLCRSRGLDRVVRAESTNGGRRWSNAAPIDLPHNNSGIDSVTLRDGRHLLVYNHTVQGRTPLNAGISSDFGRSWKSVLVLEDEPGEYSYPAVIQASDGVIHATYTWQRRKIRHVSFPPAALG